MISLRQIERRDGKWYISGSSEVFDTREGAIKRIMSQRTNKTKRVNRGRKFISEKLNMEFRSNWEIELAELMTELGINWEFEPERFYFRGEKESYLPDFFLPDHNCWIEVKGYMDKRSLRRVKLFKKYHGKNTAFFLYEKQERELVLKDPKMLYMYIEIAEREYERMRKRDSM